MADISSESSIYVSEKDDMHWIEECLNDSSGQSEESITETKLKASLAEWVVECNIPRSHVSNLLKRLHNDGGLKFLPLDSRTLMASKREKIRVIDMPPGKYHHLPVEPSLHSMLVNAVDSRGDSTPDELRMLINIDGLPLSNSSASDFWPILGKVMGKFCNFFFISIHLSFTFFFLFTECDNVFVAGIYQGPKKPADVNMYLQAFRDDIKNYK